MPAMRSAAGGAGRVGTAPSPGSATYLALKDAIMRGNMAPGTRLVENSLAEEYGVSRTPVREALRHLERDGLVERFERGMRVRLRGPEEILEIYKVRIVLESMAAHDAATARTELDLLRLDQAQTNLRKSSPDDPNAVFANRAFHQVLWHAAHNGTLYEVLAQLNLQVQRFTHPTLEYPGRWEEMIAEYAELVDAVRLGNGERAGEIAGQHMQRVRDVRLLMLAEEFGL